MATLVFFSQQRLALQAELRNHPDICEKLATAQHPNYETILADISARLGIILDGAYLPHELDKLCDILTKKLYERRTMILLPPSSIPQ